LVSTLYGYVCLDEPEREAMKILLEDETESAVNLISSLSGTVKCYSNKCKKYNYKKCSSHWGSSMR
jgi:hypothetical protein